MKPSYDLVWARSRYEVNLKPRDVVADKEHPVLHR